MKNKLKRYIKREKRDFSLDGCVVAIAIIYLVVYAICIIIKAIIE